MHLQCSGTTCATKILRQRRYCLQFFQGARGCIVREHRDRRLDFIDHIKESPAGVKNKLARPSARMERGERWIVRNQLPLRRVKVINKNLVQTEVGNENKAVVG